MSCWEVIEINVRDWRREKFIILSLSIVRALGVDLGGDKKVRVRL